MGNDDEISKGDDPGHAQSTEDLKYPTLEFEDGGIEANGSFDLSRDVDYDEMADLAEDLADALGSHDLGVSTPNGFLTLGVGPQEVDAVFEPGEDHRGELELTFRLSAKAMFVAGDEETPAGSRGGKGFVPLSMLTSDRELYRCYNWIDEPEEPE
ncbi:hypothetical protein HPS36_15965 (plasmid) [Halorubrum salinarum]|uniref:Amphi-Trp domain-containing protein n=1 Tax=Halorubrum salinarum TaxID=2739057 RepID=A0A7D3YCJ2_9EURY|nr:hypothetical protein [Halorubrum salinarum]QKG94365.1 hypothetical protein HPS36_15965 [Halorubrum salinarum]